MPGGTESNGTGIGEFPSLVLGTATLYRNFFQFGFGMDIGIIEFFLPNSRAILPTFHTNCPDGSHFAQMGSDFAQKTTTNPCSLLSRH